MPSWEFSIVVLVMGVQVSFLKIQNGDRSNKIRKAQNELIIEKKTTKAPASGQSRPVLRF